MKIDVAKNTLSTDIEYISIRLDSKKILSIYSWISPKKWVWKIWKPQTLYVNVKTDVV